MEKGQNVLIYGAYGYTGRLIVEQAVQQGWKPTIAGRSEEKTRRMAEEFDLPYASFTAEDQQAWDKALSGKDVLVNCAGPFSYTIRNILPACIRNRTHYTDISGEFEVFEYLAEQNEQAKEAGITMMSGTGFGIVVTDSMAKYLSEKLPSATSLELAFDSGSGVSRGTALSLLKRFEEGGAYRKNGKITYYPSATLYKTIFFGGIDRLCVGITWGDVYTAYYTTGIPDITTYLVMPEKAMKTMRFAGKLGWLVRTKLVQRLGRYYIRRRIYGPDEEKRKNYRCYIWGSVTDPSGKVMTAELETPESYHLASMSALLCAEKILKGEAETGFQTPAGAFGADLVMEIPGVSRKLTLFAT